MSTTMFRTTVVRSIPRSLQALHAAPARSPLCGHVLKASLRTLARPGKASGLLSLALRHPHQTALVRHATNAASYDWKKAEEALQKETLKPSVAAAPQAAIGSAEESSDDVDMMAGIRGDFNTIRDTFSLRDVPREALLVGLAGVVPYLATSLTTIYLSFDIQYAATHGQGLFLSGEVAEQLLHLIEPIQLGYGATIISFLGAIHWGLEFAGYGGYKHYPRYAMGVVATAVAWPTLLLPVELGLISQFLAFTFLYYNDARAAAHGWAPQWYGIYRFVLTFVVGASIVASLVGHGQVADLVTRPPGPADRMRAIRQKQLAELEAEGAEEKAASGEEDEE